MFTELPRNVLVDAAQVDSTGVYAIREGVDITSEIKAYSRVILFAVPGAFTPTCHEQHLPGYIQEISNLKRKGVEKVFCLSVNDRFVMKAWAEHTSGCVEAGIVMLADGNSEYTCALGMGVDEYNYGMGFRSRRYAALIEGGIVKSVLVDDDELLKTSAVAMLSLL